MTIRSAYILSALGLWGCASSGELPAQENISELGPSNYSSYLFTGIITTGADNAAVPFCNVLFLSDSVVLTGASTGFDGRYEVWIPRSSAITLTGIAVSNIGYASMPKLKIGLSVLSDSIVNNDFKMEAIQFPDSILTLQGRYDSV